MPRIYKTKTNRAYHSHRPQTLPDQYEPGFVTAMDGRTGLVKTLMENYRAILNDICGDEGTSHIKHSLIERYVWLEMMISDIEVAMASGELKKEIALGRWVQAVNSLIGLAKVLGVEQRSNIGTTESSKQFDWDAFYQRAENPAVLEAVSVEVTQFESSNGKPDGK